MNDSFLIPSPILQHSNDLGFSSEIAFLGVCDRGSNRRFDTKNGGMFLATDILSLTYFAAPLFYPFNIAGLILCFAFSDKVKLNEEYKIHIYNERKNSIGFINITPTLYDAKLGDLADQAKVDVFKKAIADDKGIGWHLYPIKLGTDCKILAYEPGMYTMVLEKDGAKQIVGRLGLALSEVPPLTDEMREAIKSNPTAAKFARIEIGCSKCPGKSKIYTALERDASLESQGYTFNLDAPDKFSCECGDVYLDQTSLKKNLHGLLGDRSALIEDLTASYLPLYEKSSLETIYRDYVRILKDAKKEEEIQVFFESNKILFSQFSPSRILNKPKLLSQYVADFAILDSRKELILVEIEMPDTFLITKKGGVGSGLNHAMDQVNDWVHLLERHRSAILDDWGIDEKSVLVIKGIVIAGRDKGYSPESLKKTKWRFARDTVRFYTYDDIASNLVSLIDNFSNM